MSLTPQFFENKPVDLFFGEGVRAEYFNRFKLGRTLDDIYGYGCSALFGEVALGVCQQEAVDVRFNSEDTTNFSVYGDYVPETDSQAILLNHGHSKARRPDLKQATLELLVSHDGGVPLQMQCWDGNAEDSEVFQVRCAALMEEFKASHTPRYVIMDSKGYTRKNAENLAQLRFITRIPETLKAAQEAIDQAWRSDAWQELDRQLKYYRVDLSHYGIEQRWLVVHSKDAEQRAQKVVAKAQAKEEKEVTKQLFHLQATRFESQQAAQAALNQIEKSLKYHQITQMTLTSHLKYAKKGRPAKDTPIKAILWQLHATLSSAPEKVTQRIQHKACFVVGTNIPDTEVADAEAILKYKDQSVSERGFKFLKDPAFFVSSLFVKKPCRIEGLLMVMTLALLVYTVAQRRLRSQLAKHSETLPNQIRQEIDRPTLRWVFQLLDGIHRVVFRLHNQVNVVIEGLTALKKKILRLFGQNVCHIYQISLE
jgi:transposase